MMSEASAAYCSCHCPAPAVAIAACRPYLVRYLRSLGASAEDAEDLAQDTLLIALRAIPSFRGDSRLSTWLCRIARRIYAHWRAQGIPSISLPKEEDVPLLEGPEEGVLRRMALCEAVSYLPEPLRLQLYRHYFQGCSYRDICRVRGISKSQLTNELSSARRLLRKRLSLPSE